MKALMTGVTGFIGSHVAELLLSHGDEVLGVAPGGWHNDAPSVLTNSVELLKWDIQNAAPEELVEQFVAFAPDVVFHFAGISIPALCGKDKPTEKAIAVNVEGTGNVLDLIEELGRADRPGQGSRPGDAGNGPRLIFASTCHVYDRVDATSPHVKEDSTIKPISAYGETKLLGEEKIRQRADAVNACIVRGFHHIGPRQPSGLMLTDWLEQLVDPAATELHVRSTGSYLDLVDVRDAAEAYRLLALKGNAGEVYNLGSGRISKSGDVLAAILSLVDRDLKLVVGSTDERWNTIANVDKLASLGWEPKTQYVKTIRDMLS